MRRRRPRPGVPRRSRVADAETRACYFCCTASPNVPFCASRNVPCELQGGLIAFDPLGTDAAIKKSCAVGQWRGGGRCRFPLCGEARGSMADDRRRDVRTAATVPVRIDGAIAGSTRDVSASGVYMILAREAALGASM